MEDAYNSLFEGVPPWYHPKAKILVRNVSGWVHAYQFENKRSFPITVSTCKTWPIEITYSYDNIIDSCVQSFTYSFFNVVETAAHSGFLSAILEPLSIALKMTAIWECLARHGCSNRAWQVSSVLPSEIDGMFEDDAATKCAKLYMTLTHETT